MAMNKKIHPVLNLFLLFVYIFMVTYSGRLLINSLNLKYNSETVSGEIKNYYTRIGEARFIWNRKPVYAPVITFVTEAGQETEIITSTYKEKMKYKKGDVVTVYYNTDDPKIAHIDDSFKWFRDGVLFFIGLVGLCYTIPPVLDHK